MYAHPHGCVYIRKYGVIRSSYDTCFDLFSSRICTKIPLCPEHNKINSFSLHQLDQLKKKFESLKKENLEMKENLSSVQEELVKKVHCCVSKRNIGLFQMKFLRGDEGYIMFQ